MLNIEYPKRRQNLVDLDELPVGTIFTNGIESQSTEERIYQRGMQRYNLAVECYSFNDNRIASLHKSNVVEARPATLTLVELAAPVERRKVTVENLTVERGFPTNVASELAVGQLFLLKIANRADAVLIKTADGHYWNFSFGEKVRITSTDEITLLRGQMSFDRGKTDA